MPMSSRRPDCSVKMWNSSESGRRGLTAPSSHTTVRTYRIRRFLQCRNASYLTATETSPCLRVAYLLHQLIRQGSLLVPCRERLLLYSYDSTSSARAAVAAVRSTLLLLRVHRNRPPAPCIGRFGPSPGWATMASADFSGSIPPGCPCGSPMLWTEPETSRGKMCLLLSDPSDLPVWRSE